MKKILRILALAVLVSATATYAYTSSSISGGSSVNGGSQSSGNGTVYTGSSVSSTTSSSANTSTVGGSSSVNSGSQVSDTSTVNSGSQVNSTSQASGSSFINDSSNAGYAPQVCTTYIVNYIKIGENNNAQDVKNLQIFLNTYEGERLIVDGVYKDVDVQAVKRFQTKYMDTLKFWGLTEATGQVLQTTINKINTIYCEKKQALTCPYFGTYQKLGSSSNEVIKIKKFLNNTQGENLDTSSNLYDVKTSDAVKRFQNKYLNTALKPWGLTYATGYWYQSTRKTAHDIIGCFEAVRLDNGVVLR